MLITIRKEYTDSPKVKNAAYRLIGYPIILILTWIPAVIDRIYGIISGYSYILVLLHLSINTSLGFFNAVYYIYCRRDEFAVCCKRVFYYRNKEDSSIIRECNSDTFQLQ